MGRACRGGVAAGFIALGAVPALAQGPTIEHDPIGCVVAGRYPRLSACFSPPAVARARALFRGEGPHWYWVDGKRRVHETIGSASEPACYDWVLPKPKKSLKTLHYYLDVITEKFGEGRTAEYSPDVVPDRGACRKDVPVAPFLEKAAVTVGVPPGATLIGFTTGTGSSGPLLGVLAGGAAVGGGLAVAGGGGGSGSTTLPGSSTTSTSTTTTSTTSTTTSTTSTTSTTTTSTTTTTTMPACRPVNPSLTSPANGSSIGGRVAVSCTVPGARRGCPSRVVLRYSSRANSGTIGTFNAPPYDAVWDTTRVSNGRYEVICVAEFGSQQRSDSVTVDVANVFVTSRDAERTAAAPWTSRLGVPGGRGQVVLDGSVAVYDDGSGTGTSATSGPHRIEAQLVTGEGRPGTWRFDLGRSVVPGSVRIVAGEAALVTPDAVVFRMSGRPGERLVFLFVVGDAMR